jgi:hypothetical protein
VLAQPCRLSSGGMVIHLWHGLPDVEVVRGSEGKSLDRGNKERHDEHLNGTSYPQLHAYLVYIVPVRDRQRIGELPILVHEVELVSRQEHGQDQLHFQLGHLHPCTRVSAGSPTQERMDSARNRIRS